MDKSDRVEELIRLLSSLDAGEMGDKAAARELARLDPVEAAHALGSIVGRAKNSPAVGRALMVVSRALLFGTDADLPYTHRGRIYDAAAEFGLSEVAGLFLTDAAAQEVDPNAAPPPADPEIGQMTLGHKKTLARKASPDKMARLASEGDPRVIRELLLNPRLTEGLVVRIVAKRPTKAEVLLEVVKSPKWSVRQSVRRAMAMNPYTPTEVTLKLLPHLVATDLKMIAGDRQLHSSVREVAAKLSRKRVPPPA